MTPEMVPLWFDGGNRQHSSTHALVIGVSAYRHPPYGLKNLRGAARSALRFAEWLHGQYRPPDAPLASIRLLVAPVANELTAGEQERTGRPDRTTTLSALEAWKNDCCSSSDNVAVLYVAGHGFRESLDGALVLMEDAGATPKDFAEALDIEGVRAALVGLHAPRRQYYFVDACRRVATSLPPGLKHPIVGGVAPNPGAEDRLPSPVFYAAAPDYDAHIGDEGSVFVDALVSCLRLDAVERVSQDTDTWAVRDDSLQRALGSRIPEYAARGGKGQRSGPGGTPLYEVFTLADRPLVPFELDVDPIHGRVGARARVFNDDDDEEALADHPLPISNQTVPAGAWNLALGWDRSPPPFRPLTAKPIHVAGARYRAQLKLTRPELR